MSSKVCVRGGRVGTGSKVLSRGLSGGGVVHYIEGSDTRIVRGVEVGQVHA